MKTEFCIIDIKTHIVDIPTVRKHRLSSLAINKQTYVIVIVTLGNGITGLGEGTTLGGPIWSEESPESIQITIEKYFKPYILKQAAKDFKTILTILNRCAKRNNAAKSALFMAIWDAVSKSQNKPAWQLIGDLNVKTFPVLWALASGNANQEIEEALLKIEKREHKEFKVKIGVNPPEEDIKRLGKIAKAIEGKGQLKVVDANQAWDRKTASCFIPMLEEIGVEILEQPLPFWDVDGMKQLSQTHSLNIMADESIFDVHDADSWFSSESVNSVSLKLVKHSNPFTMQQIAKRAIANNIQLYGGCLLESSIGTSAHLHSFATLERLTLGTECFGPRILEANLTNESIIYKDFEVQVPQGAGLGLTLNMDVLKKYKRN